MQEKTRKTIKLVIDNHKQAIKNIEIKIALKKNPNLLVTTRDRDKIEICKILSRLRDQYTELLPFVKNIRKNIQDITETTHACAVYLLLCHTFKNWNSMFLLAEHGKNPAIQTLLRMIRESLMLVNLFTVEFSKNEEKNLNKWFSGEIISHSIGRKITNEFFDKYSPHPTFDTKKFEAYIYQVESQTPHNSYASVLECISPFTEDFDFNGYTDFYHTKSALKYAEGTITTTNIALIVVYRLLLKDQDGFEKVNKILRKYNPNVNQCIPNDIQREFSK